MAKLPHLKTAVLILLAVLTMLFLLVASQLTTAASHTAYLPIIQIPAATPMIGGPDPWPHVTITPIPAATGGPVYEP